MTLFSWIFLGVFSLLLVMGVFGALISIATARLSDEEPIDPPHRPTWR